jgi:hypothetical protein
MYKKNYYKKFINLQNRQAGKSAEYIFINGRKFVALQPSFYIFIYLLLLLLKII